jgi:tetratricopeptide (TPR) repeat protein
MKLGRNLRRLRLQRGLTQRQLAEPAYTDAYVSTIEAGRRQPSRNALEHFARKLEVTYEELVSGIDPGVPAQLELDLHDARKLLAQGHLERSRASYEAILATTTRFGLRRLEAVAEWGLGMCDERAGDFDSAIDHYDEVQNILGAQDLIGGVQALTSKARVLLMAGDVRYAIHILEDRLQRLVIDGLGDPDSLVRLHASLVAAYFEAGLYKMAHASAGEALRLAPKASDLENLANMNLNVARVSLQKGNIPQTHDFLRRAELLLRQLDLTDQLSRAHFARGYVFSRQGDVDGARKEFETARAMLESIDSPIEGARVTTELGRLARIEGDADEAQALLARSIAALRDADPAELGQAHRELGLCLMGSDDAGAEKSFRRAIELFERSDETVEMAVTHRALGDLFTGRGEADAGCESYRTGLQILERDL